MLKFQSILANNERVPAVICVVLADGAATVTGTGIDKSLLVSVIVPVASSLPPMVRFKVFCLPFSNVWRFVISVAAWLCNDTGRSA